MLLHRNIRHFSMSSAVGFYYIKCSKCENVNGGVSKLCKHCGDVLYYLFDDLYVPNRCGEKICSRITNGRCVCICSKVNAIPKDPNNPEHMAFNGANMDMIEQDNGIRVSRDVDEVMDQKGILHSDKALRAPRGKVGFGQDRFYQYSFDSLGVEEVFDQQDQFGQDGLGDQDDQFGQDGLGDQDDQQDQFDQQDQDQFGQDGLGDQDDQFGQDGLGDQDDVLGGLGDQQDQQDQQDDQVPMRPVVPRPVVPKPVGTPRRVADLLPRAARRADGPQPSTGLEQEFRALRKENEKLITMLTRERKDRADENKTRDNYLISELKRERDGFDQTLADERYGFEQTLAAERKKFEQRLAAEKKRFSQALAAEKKKFEDAFTKEVKRNDAILKREEENSDRRVADVKTLYESKRPSPVASSHFIPPPTHTAFNGQPMNVYNAQHVLTQRNADNYARYARETGCSTSLSISMDKSQGNPIFWSCSKCTYDNVLTDSKCAICGNN